MNQFKELPIAEKNIFNIIFNYGNSIITNQVKNLGMGRNTQIGMDSPIEIIYVYTFIQNQLFIYWNIVGKHVIFFLRKCSESREGERIGKCYEPHVPSAVSVGSVLVAINLQNFYIINIDIYL